MASLMSSSSMSTTAPAHRLPASSLSFPPLRYAVLGAGFAGLSVAWHLLKQSPQNSNLSIDLYDEVGIGGGASGVSGGLLHPYSPKVKLLWQGDQFWKECLTLLNTAEAAHLSNIERGTSNQGFLVRRRGILRPATNMKSLNLMEDNARNCLASCRVDTIGKDAAENLVPNLCLPFGTAFYMPEAINLNPMCYLQALFLACQHLAKASNASSSMGKQLRLHKKSLPDLLELEAIFNYTCCSDEADDAYFVDSLSIWRDFLKWLYDAVIICLGAKADSLSELAGKLPIRTCRGVIVHMELPDNMGEEYPGDGPSILSDAWLAIQDTRTLHMGSTWDWKSKNSSPDVSEDEASKALHELVPKASAVYPSLKNWSLIGARAGLRAMPPLTPHGSLPLLGCVDDLVGSNSTACKYWLVGGLGSRGLFFHGWLGKLMARAVLYRNEELIPSELTSWKKMKQ